MTSLLDKVSLLSTQPTNEDHSWLARLPEHMLRCHRTQEGDGSGCHWRQSMGIERLPNVLAPSDCRLLSQCLMRADRCHLMHRRQTCKAVPVCLLRTAS